VSAVFLNIVFGLVTSIVSGGSIWVWHRTKDARSRRGKAAFFGLEAGGTCLIVMNNKWDAPGSVSNHDVHTMIEIATLASEIGNPISVLSSNEFHGLNGSRTEFCIGGPGSNPRTTGHLAAHLPGVAILPIDVGQPASGAFVVGGRRYLRDKGRREHALIARFTPPGSSRPVLLISGQRAIANRAAIYYLKREYRDLAKTVASVDRFCVVVRLDASDTYGYQAVSLERDVTAEAFVGS
jgi:hypothetical protein